MVATVSEKLSLLEPSTSHVISFGNFIESTFPRLKKHHTLVNKAEEIIVNLERFCEKDDDESFAYVRGGAMRMFLYQTQKTEDSISHFYNHLPESLQGINHLTQQVIGHAFEQKDIDIHTKRNPKIRHDDKQTMMILEELAALDGYRSEVTVQTDKSKSFFHIDFYKGQTTQPVLTLSINDISTTEEEFRTDIRDEPNASKVDQLARGKLFLDRGKPLLFFDSTLLDYFLTDVVLDPDKKRQGFKEFLTVPELIGGLRTAGMASFFIPIMLNSHPEIAKESTFAFFIKHSRSISDELRAAQNIPAWLKKNQHELENRQTLIISDALYPLTVSPIFFLANAYFNGYLSYLPLGRYIDSDNKLFAVLYEINRLFGEGNLAKDTFYETSFNNADLIGPFKLIIALQNLNLLSKFVPINMDTVVDLLNPA